MSNFSYFMRFGLGFVIWVLLLLTSACATAGGRTYYSSYHNDEIYQYKPKYFKGEELTKKQAIERNMFFRETTRGDQIVVELFLNGVLTSTTKMTRDGVVIEHTAKNQRCEYLNENDQITEACFSREGTFISKQKKYFVNDLLIKTEQVDTSGNVLSFSIYDYVDWREFVFSGRDSFVESLELMRSGK